MIDDLSNQVDRTNEAFCKRIAATRYAKTVLESIHNCTALKANEITKNIINLEKELADKEGYIGLCQIRLANRAQRPDVELCHDSVQQTLNKELTLLKQTVGNLSQMLAEVNFIVFVNPLTYANMFAFSLPAYADVSAKRVNGGFLSFTLHSK